jgi:broad specificity phosphatase PhoE
VRFRTVLALTLTLLGSIAGTRVTVATNAAVVHAPDSTVATIILVRHAERDTMLIGPDHPLRAVGVLRAQALVHTLGASGISTIYVTPWLRNRQTALPLATALGESLTVVDEIAETVHRLRTRHFGRTVLVVGHSNTVPEIITALTGRPFPTPGRVAYDGMWVVSLARDGRASLVTLRYGAPADGAPERHPPPPPPGR